METPTTFPKRRPRRTVKRIGCTIFLLLLVVLTGFVYWKYYFTYSEGDRFGLLQKFSLKGNVFKSYEGDMILSSIQGNANVPIASEKFYFSVDSKNDADQLMKLQGQHVTVHYEQKNGTLPWRGETAYIVDSVIVNR